MTTTAPGGSSVRARAAASSWRSSSEDRALTFGWSRRTTATPSARRSVCTSGVSAGIARPYRPPRDRYRRRGVRWIVDGNNVMGAGADGWWNDPVAAAIPPHPDDRRVDAPPRRPGHGRLRRPARAPPVRAGRRPAERGVRTRPGGMRPTTASSTIVEDTYAAEPDLRVVTSDRGLAERLPPGVEVEGAGAFRTRLGLSPDRARRRRGR